MRDLLPGVQRWLAAGQGVALATVVKAWGSAPRPLGAKMAVSARGEVAGSVSGGCVEGAVFAAAQESIAAGAGRLLRFGVSDEQAWSVGLSCGGEIEVWVQPLAAPAAAAHGSAGSFDPELWRQLAGCLDREEGVVLVTALTAPPGGAGGVGPGRQLLVWPNGSVQGDLGAPRLNQRAALYVQQALASALPGRKSFPLEGAGGGPEADLFFDAFPPPDRLIIVGAVHAAIPLVAFARHLGMRTVVIDPRAVFATRERFPEADELILDWPGEALARLRLDEATSLVTLTHDLKFDLPALIAALRSPARYIGALGSGRTHGRRLVALAAEGFGDADLARIHAPIGLDLGGRRAEEIALAIAAEIVAVRHGKGGRPRR